MFLEQNTNKTKSKYSFKNYRKATSTKNISVGRHQQVKPAIRLVLLQAQLIMWYPGLSYI